MKGLVIKSTGNSCLVRTAQGLNVECIIKGNFRIKGIKSTNPVAVGDEVEITDPTSGGTSFIKAIEERRNYIVRRSSNLSKQSHILACNLDQAVLFATLTYPETSLVFVDRFLATARAYRIPVIILFNKADLITGNLHEQLRELLDLYTGIGYKCLVSSAMSYENVDILRLMLTNKITLFAGNSGVGKSTMINLLLPDLSLKTGEISDKHHTGTHTTTFSEMYEIPQGGWIIDTPGVKGFGNFNMKPAEIGHYFPEIFKISKQCRFNNCTHTEEPGCAVKEAVHNNIIAISRYQSYISMLSDDDVEKYRQPQEDDNNQE